MKAILAFLFALILTLSVALVALFNEARSDRFLVLFRPNFTNYSFTPMSSRLLLVISSYSKYFSISTPAKTRRTTTPAPTTTSKYIDNQSCGDPYLVLSYLRNYGRIVNGMNAYPFIWPWMASLRHVHIDQNTSFQLLEHFCAGVLISNSYILTSAHCVYHKRKDQFIVSLGIDDLNDNSTHMWRNLYLVDEIVYPVDNLNQNNIKSFDIALLKLARVPTRSQYVAPICLPESADLLDSIYGKSLIVIGWGGRSDIKSEATSGRLKQTVLKVINGDRLCEKYSIESQHRFYCAYDSVNNGMSNVCIGDSGGPLFMYENGRYVLYGLVSTVFTYIDINYQLKCFTQAPSYFSKVALYLDWILDEIRQ